jgi:hypothetical protein
MRDKLYLGELNGVQLDFTTGSFTDIHNITGHIRDAVLTQSVAPDITGFAPSSEAVYSFVTGVSGYLDDNNSLYEISSESTGLNAANVVLTPQDGGVTTKVTLEGLTGITVSGDASNIFIGHEDTSEETSSLNSSGIVIQSIGIDDFGHVTQLSAIDLDDRYVQSANLDLDLVTTNGNTTDNSIIVGDVTSSKLTLTGDDSATILGPSILYIDPAAHDDIGGKLVILGDLDVRGTTTYIHSTDVQIGDTNLILATGGTQSQADGAGFTISGTEGVYGSFTYSSSDDRFESSLPIYSTGGFLGNATTASALETPISVSITGDATGITTNFDGSSDLSVYVEVIDGSHDHLIANISGLQDELDSKTSNSVEIIAGSGLLGGGILTGNIQLDIGEGDGIAISGDNIAVDSTVVRTTRNIIAGSGLSGGGDLSDDITFTTVSDQGHLNNIQIASNQIDIGGGINQTYGGILVGRARGTSATAVSLTETGSGVGDLISINSDSTLTYEGIVAARDEEADSSNGEDSAAWKVLGILEKDSDSTNMLLSQVIQIAKGVNTSNWDISLSAGTSGLVLQGNGEGGKNIVWSTTLTYNVIES